MRIAVAVLLVACSSEPPAGVQPLMGAVAQPGDCIDPRTLGAIPDDGRDDRDAIQAAIDQGLGTRRPVCIGPGVYEVSRHPGRIASLLVAGDGAVVSGTGPGQTTLTMIGAWPGDWRLLELTGTGHRVTDLTLDGSVRGATPKDQIHLVQITGPARSIVLSDLRLNLPVLADMKGGDCIRLLGSEADMVDGVTIERVTMPACARSGVSLQRGVSNVWMEHVTTTLINGQAVDFEPTGAGAINGVSIRDSTLRTGHGGVAIAVSGGDSPATGIVLDRVEIDGQLFLFRVADSTFRDLSIRIADDSPIVAQKEGAGIRIVGGRFERLAGTVGPVVNILAHGGEYPTDVWIGGGVRLVQRADGPAIRTEPTTGLVVDGATVECASPTPNDAAAILLAQMPATQTQQAVSPRRTRVVGSSFVGNCKYALVTGPGGSLVFADNVVETMTGAVRFAAPPTVTPVVTGNVVSVPPGASPVVVAPASTVFVGANGT